MSVGYGDISANNNRERLFALVTMVRYVPSTKTSDVVSRFTIHRQANVGHLASLLYCDIY